MSLVLQKSFQVRGKRVEGKREGVKGKRERDGAWKRERQWQLDLCMCVLQGVVKLFSEKNPEPLAMVTVSSLTSTPADHQTEGGTTE